MGTEENKQKIRLFLTRYISKKNLGDEENFFASGFVNSLFALQLVMFVEKEFKIKVENEDLDLKNFNAVNAIAQFVERKTQSVNVMKT